jgi:peptidoglycan/xylan/chitin deacetylase (PgdA/CDA1 family)
MSATALVLTYHAVEEGPPPLCIDPGLFRAHLDVIDESRVRTVGLGQLADELRRGGPGEPSLALTFDDGFASVADAAAPLLIERRIPATIFCVAGHLGRHNDFPTDSASAPKLPLASGSALADLSAEGLDLGSHGMEHTPLEFAEDDQAALRREIVDSRELLEQETGHDIAWFAHPYGSPAGPTGRALIEGAYDGACGDGLRPVTAGTDPYRLPRIDAHYLRRPGLLRWVLEGRGGYLPLRRLGARARRTVRQDFVPSPG